jgi:hypothetical protein
MRKLYDEGTLSDVTMMIKDGSTKHEMQLHRVCLAAASDYFASMFGQQFREANSKVVDLEVAEGSSVAATEKILLHMYTREVTLDPSNMAEVTQILIAADHLQEQALMLTCCSSFLST